MSVYEVFLKDLELRDAAAGSGKEAGAGGPPGREARLASLRQTLCGLLAHDAIAAGGGGGGDDAEEGLADALDMEEANYYTVDFRREYCGPRASSAPPH